MACCSCISVFVFIATLVAAIIMSVAPYYALQIAFDEQDDSVPNRYVFRSISWGLAHGGLIPNAITTFGAALVLIVAIVREIQLRVIFERNDMYTCCIKFLNGISAFVLIIGSLSCIGAIIISTKVDEEIHFITASVSVICMELWSLLHIILTLIERCGCFEEYPSCFGRYIELLYIIPSWIISSLFWVIFLLYQIQAEKKEDNPDYDMSNYEISWNLLDSTYGAEKSYFYEWWGYWLIWTQLIVLAIMFARNQASDELNEFVGRLCCCCGVCCCCCNNNDRKDSESIEMGLYSNNV